MNISNVDLENFVNNLDVAVTPFFSPEELEQIARETGFVIRESKLNELLCLQLVVLNSENLKNQSLNVSVQTPTA